jgi:hypothetical protein
MEAYCKAVRALEDMFYSIEHNHVPAGTTRRQTSWQRSRLGGSLSPRTFLPEMSPSPPSPSSRTPRTARDPRGLPRIQQARSPWMRTPRTRRTCSPSSRGTTSTSPK